jgi:hypothetical protein
MSWIQDINDQYRPDRIGKMLPVVMGGVVKRHTTIFLEVIRAIRSRRAGQHHIDSFERNRSAMTV